MNQEMNLSQRCIYDYIKANEGCSQIEIVKEFNTSRGRVGYIIRILKDKDLIIAKPHEKNKSHVKYYIKK